MLLNASGELMMWLLCVEMVWECEGCGFFSSRRSDSDISVVSVPSEFTPNRFLTQILGLFWVWTETNSWFSSLSE